jgi:hypothetical protein
MQVEQNKITSNLAAFQALREKTRERLQTEDIKKSALQAVQQKKQELNLGNLSGTSQSTPNTHIKKLAYPQSTPVPSMAAAYTRNKTTPEQIVSPAKLGQFVDIMV